MPFDPEIRVPEIKPIDILDIAGIGPERAALLRKAGLKTVKDLARIAGQPKALADLARKTGFSQSMLTRWSRKAELLAT